MRVGGLEDRGQGVEAVLGVVVERKELVPDERRDCRLNLKADIENVDDERVPLFVLGDEIHDAEGEFVDGVDTTHD